MIDCHSQEVKYPQVAVETLAFMLHQLAWFGPNNFQAKALETSYFDNAACCFSQSISFKREMVDTHS